jgi:hypothetical protein
VVPEQVAVSPLAAVTPAPASRTSAGAGQPVPPPAEGPPPIEVLSTASGVAGRAAGRALRTPIVWVGLAIVILLLYWLLR